MRIIDAHLHFSDIQLFKETAANQSHVDYSSSGLQDAFAANDIVAGIGMGLAETQPGLFPDVDCPNPMGLNLEETIPENLYCCLGINPVKLRYDRNERQLTLVEQAIKQKKVAGLKIYLGYFAFDINDLVYQSVYELAKAYQLPVVVHCGDTFCDSSHLKYAHPLHVNQAAMAHRQIKFVLAHMGNPWVTDAAMVMANNPNVYADLSGLQIGGKQDLNTAQKNTLVVNHLKTGMEYVGDYEKFLFGSDWPLVPLGPYIQYVKTLVPQQHHETVFYANARQVFTKIDPPDAS